MQATIFTGPLPLTMMQIRKRRAWPVDPVCFEHLSVSVLPLANEPARQNRTLAE